MKIEIKSKKIQKQTFTFIKLITNTFDGLEIRHVKKVVICDDDNFENCVIHYDKNSSITKFTDCIVQGKTIPSKHGSIVILNSDVIVTLRNEFKITDTKKILFSDNAIQSLKTIFHEFGHAKNNTNNGKIEKLTAHYNDHEFVNYLWKILRDEYLAEKHCAKMYEIFSSYEWYGSFDDKIEEENFKKYLKEYQDSNNKINGHLSLQLLHQYYLIPLFYKAGFIDGLRSFLDIKAISTAPIIEDIMNCDVIDNKSVPEKFNEIILKKWNQYNIKDYIENVA